MLKEIGVGIALVVVFMVGYGFGFAHGGDMVIDKVIDIGQRFIEIEIDREAIDKALWQYDNEIAACYPIKIENGTYLLNDSGIEEMR